MSCGLACRIWGKIHRGRENPGKGKHKPKWRYRRWITPTEDMRLPGWEGEAQQSVMGQWSLLGREGVNWGLKDVSTGLKRKEHFKVGKKYIYIYKSPYCPPNQSLKSMQYFNDQDLVKLWNVRQDIKI